jgi:23S rRNA (uracil1939-C5)-methyltransferase
MARKRIESFILENVEIIDAASDGKAVAKHDGKVFFVKQGVPGDVVDIKVYKKNKRFFEAEIVKQIKPSPYRQSHPCMHFGYCGGCKWQHMSYSAQLQYKQKQVIDAFERIGKLSVENIEQILPAPDEYYYRNKLEFTFSHAAWLKPEELNNPQIIPAPALGFHIPGMFDKILPIHQCLLMDDIQNKIRNSLYTFALNNNISFFNLKVQSGLLRNLVVRISNTNQLMVIVIFNSHSKEDEINQIKILEFLNNNFPQITSLQYIVNNKRNDSYADLPVNLYYGLPYLEEKMESLTFRISANSFFQTNSKQALQLYKLTRDFAALSGNEMVYDLYTGTGTIANFIALKCKKVIGLEYVSAAVKDAEINSQINGIVNTLFFAGDMKDILTDDFIHTHGKPDVVITDPPRSGMHQDVVKVILNAAPDKIVYVSCNPQTQARDLALMKDVYFISKIQPVDMFPHTHHVENIVLLEKK